MSILKDSVPTVALALRARDSGPAHPLMSAIRALGCNAFQVRDGDPAGLSSDLLVIYGNCRAFHGYAELLGSLRGRRPHVAIWQIDPLPPIEFDRRLETQVLARLTRQSNSGLLRSFIKLSQQGIFARVAREGFGPYSDRTNGNRVDAAMARTVVEAFAFLKRGVEDGWIDRIYPSTVGKQKFLASRGFGTTSVAPASYFDGIGENRRGQRDIDVVFIGRLTAGARRLRLDRVRKALESRKITVRIVERNCFGDERTALLNRAKIVLHLHKYPWDTPFQRWAIAASCGAAVVSETLSDPAPFRPGVHYVEAPFEELPQIVDGALAEPWRLQAMADDCLLHVREKSSLHRSLPTVLSESIGFGAQPRAETTEGE